MPETKATPVRKSDLLWFGEDSQWLACPGHVDIAQFTKCAISLAKELDYEVDDGLGEEPRHVWMRPAVRSDFTSDEEFAQAEAEDWHQWGGVTAETPGAVPWTLVGMEW